MLEKRMTNSDEDRSSLTTDDDAGNVVDDDVQV